MVTGETGARTGPWMRGARGACVRRLWAREGVGNGVQLVCGSCWGRHLWGTQGGLSLAGGILWTLLTGRETELFTVKVILTFWQFDLKITFFPIRKKAITGTEQFTSWVILSCQSVLFVWILQAAHGDKNNFGVYKLMSWYQTWPQTNGIWFGLVASCAVKYCCH